MAHARRKQQNTRGHYSTAKTSVSVLYLAILAQGCSGGDRDAMSRDVAIVPSAGAEDESAIRRALDDAFETIAAEVDSIQAILLPVPLLTAAEESGLRRFGSAEQLARARSLGGLVADTAAIARLAREGRLVRLEDSTALWVVRKLDHSAPWVTPDTKALLDETASRFQARLRDMRLPPFRLEVSSALRTAEQHEALRRVNPNAARGESTHQYGTAIDIAYSGYAAPLDPVVDLETYGESWLEPRLERLAGAFLETVAARNSRELQAVLGKVLLELQAEGAAMVTLERLQPVYHITLARATR